MAQINIKIPIVLIERILEQIEDIEDLLERIDVIDYYTNKDRANDMIRINLDTISKVIETIAINFPTFQEQLIETTQVDFIKIGKIIQNGYWHANYKNGWNAALATEKLKKVILECGINQWREENHE